MTNENEKQHNKFVAKMLVMILTTLLYLALLVSATVGLLSSRDESRVIVTSADVKMDLLQANSHGEYYSIKGSDGKVFGEDVWEPGKTKVVFIKVRSDSNIKVKYTLRLNVTESELDGAFECFAYESAYFDTTGYSYAEILALANKDAQDMIKGLNVLTGSSFITITPGEEHCYALVLRMKGEAGNEYQGKVASIDINVIATQGNATEGDIN